MTVQLLAVLEMEDTGITKQAGKNSKQRTEECKAAQRKRKGTSDRGINCESFQRVQNLISNPFSSSWCRWATSYSDLPTSTSSNEALNNTQKNPCRSWRWGPRWPRGHAICSSITFTTCWVSLAAFFNTCSHLLTWWSTVFPPRLTSPRRIRLWSLSHIWAQVIRQQVHKGGSCSLLLSTKILLLVSSNQAR